MQATEAILLRPTRDRSASARLRRSLTLVRRQPLGAAGAIIIVIFLFFALTATVLPINDPRAFVGGRLKPPSADFLLGTNNLGQDVFARTVYGSQVSLSIGVATVLFGTLGGSLLGLLGGYFGRWLDLIIQRLLEVIAAFPPLVLTLVVVAALGRPHVSRDANLFQLTWELRTIVLAIGIGFLFGSTRIIRSAVIAERNAMYVDAAKACGAGAPRIIFMHILPNVTAYIIVGISVTLGLAILVEASLSFLGYGVPPGTPSWGADLSGPNRQFFLQAPWLLLAPGGAISLTLLGFNLLGDAVRDLLDPRLRGR
jgi:peptide/nickel transport system permease protein